MPDEYTISASRSLPISATLSDNSDHLESAGQFVLELIRKTAIAAREVTFGGGSRAADQSGAFFGERLTALEAQIARYPDLKQKTDFCDTALTETQRNLLERTEEAKDSYRKFVDAAALLRAANDEVSSLKNALQKKELEVFQLKQESEQMIAYLRSLLAMIDAQQATNDADCLTH